jgi:hypothetical protein
VKSLLEDTHDFPLDIVFGDEFNIRLVDLVALIKVDIHVVNGSDWIESHVILLFGLDDIPDLVFVQDDDFSDIAAWKKKYFLRDLLKESW